MKKFQLDKKLSAMVNSWISRDLRNTNLTRTKTSIRYAKENDKEKRERRKERERKVEGEI